jgi:hypothetical protein
MPKKLKSKKPSKHKGEEYDEPNIEKFSHIKKKGKHKGAKTVIKD